MTAAQEVARPLPPVLVVNLDRLYAESKTGEDIRAALDALEREAQLENDKLVAELIAEEQDLARRRPDMEVADFRAEAAAFDAKAQRIRAERDAKEREIAQARTDAVIQFRDQARGIVGQVMLERNGIVVLDSRTVFIALSAVDITLDVIARLDANLQSTQADQ